MLLCVSLDGSADQSADEPAKKRGSDFAPVIRVQCAAVTAVVMPRLMAVCHGRRRRCMAGDLMPGFRAHGRYVCFRLHSHRCRRCMPRGGRSFRRMRLLHGSLHRRRRFPPGRSASFRSRHRRSAESAADRECHHHLLYCLVHCRVPFILCASPFSRLHRVRTHRRKFLTNFQTRYLRLPRGYSRRRLAFCGVGLLTTLLFMNLRRLSLETPSARHPHPNTLSM